MASNILNVLENVEKGRQNCIKNAKLANLPATDNMDIFNIGNLFLEQNNTEFVEEEGPWVRPSDWWDTKSILENAQNIEQDGVVYFPTYIILLNNSTDTAMLKKSQTSGDTTSADGYVFSDEPDILYVGDQTHTWDASKDKPCSEGYSTRYIIAYMIDRNIANTIKFYNNLPILELIFGNIIFPNSQRQLTVSQNQTIVNIETTEKTVLEYYQITSSIEGDVNLKNISLPTTTMIGTFTGFRNVPTLISFSAQNLNRINQSSFLTDVRSLRYIDIPNVTYINYGSLTGSYLKSIELPSLTELSYSVFDNSTNLKSIVLPNLTKCSGMLYNCYNLKEVNMPALEEITTTGGNYFIYSCFNLETLSFPVLKKVSKQMCAACYNLKEVSIPQLETMTAPSNFSNCYSLTEFTFPNTFLSLTQPTQFQGCVNLNTINLVTNWRWSLNVKDTDLTHECIIDMFNKLKDLTGADSLTLTIGANNLAKVTDEELQIPNSKNWTVQ